MSQKKLDKIIFLDVETTGTEDQDRLVQVAYQLRNISNDGKVNGLVNEVNDLFKPPLPISIDAMSICHITNDMVAEKTSFKDSDVRKELQDVFDSNSAVFVAHNADFDMKFIAREGMELPKRHICTLKVSHHHDKKAELGKNSLQYLRYYYNLEFEQQINPHDAMSDVLVLERLFEYYLQFYTIDEMVEISSKPILFKKMMFGKHKDEWFKDIARSDLDYLIWARRAMDLDENMKYTLEYWINNR